MILLQMVHACFNRVTVTTTFFVIEVPSLFVVVCTGIVKVPVSDVISDASEENSIVVNGEVGVSTPNPLSCSLLFQYR